MKPLLFIILIGLSLPIKPLEPRYTVEVDLGIGDKTKVLVEPSREVHGAIGKGNYYTELKCLSTTLYHESRGEPDRGIQLIAQVILNRTEDSSFPTTICEVVKQKRGRVYQFSYWNNKNLEIKDLQAYEKVYRIATQALEGKFKSFTKTTFYKRCDVESKFFDTLTFKGAVGKHCYFQVASR